MRDSRGKALQGLISILLLKNLALEAYLVDMLGHVLEVDRYYRAVQVFYILGSYHGVVLFKLRLFRAVGT